MRFFRREASHQNPALDPVAGGDEGRPVVPRLIVGLGNPGSQYAHNRHNIGFWTVNRLARRAGAAFLQHSRTATVAEGRLAGRAGIPAQTPTVLNTRGQAARWLLRS